MASVASGLPLYLEVMTTFSAVVTTGIYCRPGCGAKPLAENVRTFELAAEAEAAGFRACLRCRPYRVAGPVAAGALRAPAARRVRPDGRRRGVRVRVRQPAPVQPGHAAGLPGLADRA